MFLLILVIIFLLSFYNALFFIYNENGNQKEDTKKITQKKSIPKKGSVRSDPAKKGWKPD